MKKLLNLLICGIVPSLILVACDSGGENTTNSNSSPTANQLSQGVATQSKFLMINTAKTSALTNGYLFIGAEDFQQPSLGAWLGNVFQCTVTNGTINNCSALDSSWGNLYFNYVYRMNIANK